MTKNIDMRQLLRNLPAIAGNYPEFDVARSVADPTEQFAEWLDVAISADVPEPHAMTLSTVDGQGRPDARVLLLKDLDAEGWHFAANSESPKGKQIHEHSEVALTFYWPALARQVRIKGQAVKGRGEQAAADFVSRSLGSRATALVGHQSEVLLDPAVLDSQFKLQLERLEASPSIVDRSWALYVVRAQVVEFWQGCKDRRHVRLRYLKDSAGWSKSLLWP